MRILYWRFLAFVKRHPFVMRGLTLRYCWRCAGWGQDAAGYECRACRGQGYVGRTPYMWGKNHAD